MNEEKGVGLKGWLSGPGRKESKTKGTLQAGSNRHRVAILPLSNISPDPHDEYFADGMTDEVISTVSRIEGLEVISRTSVMHYKKDPKPIRDVSRELDVGTVLEGTVRKAGKKLRVSVQMIDAEKDRHLWTESYDRNLEDIFEIQSDIAKQVAEALQVQLLPASRRRIEKSPTSSVEAYSLYLKARPYSDRRDREALNAAVGYYERAIAIDPKFALAYTGLARSYSGLAFHGMIPAKEAGVKARMNAERALRIDETIAEAHREMGTILRNFDWDLLGAEKEFNRAIELNPSLALAHSSKALLLMFKKRAEEAISAAKRALELDPLSGTTLHAVGTVYLYVGLYDDAIRQFEKALAIDPENSFARGNYGLSLVQKGMLEEGIREIEKVAVSLATTGQSDLAYAYAKAGRVDDLNNLLKRLLNEVKTNREFALAVASAYANLGDADLSLEWLERAYSEHVTALISANADFAFDKVRGNPQFQALMRRLGYTSPNSRN